MGKNKLAYDTLVLGEGKKNGSPIEAVQKKSYDEGVNDEFVIPTIITEEGEPIATIDSEDSIIFFNFRPDRARQITRAIVDEDFSGFERDKKKLILFMLP